MLVKHVTTSVVLSIHVAQHLSLVFLLYGKASVAQNARDTEVHAVVPCCRLTVHKLPGTYTIT